MRALSDRQHAALAIVVLLLLLSPLAWAPYKLWTLYQHYEQHAERAADTLARYQRVVRDTAEVRKEIERFTREGTARYFFAADVAPALVTGRMQKKINELADASGATINSTRVLRVEDDGKPYRRHGISVNMRADIEALRKVLHGLHAATPRMWIDGLRIRGGPRARRRKGKPQARKLSVTFNLHAYQLKAS